MGGRGSLTVRLVVSISLSVWVVWVVEGSGRVEKWVGGKQKNKLTLDQNIIMF